MPAITATPPIDIRMMNSLATLLFALALLSFAVVGVRWFVRLPAFAIQSIHVDGETQHNTPASVRKRALPRIEGNVFTLDLAQAKRVFETMPWVRRAIVRRVWPDQIAVTLEEHRAAAYWHEDARDDELVNHFGEVFQANLADVDDEGLPMLQGPAGTASHVLQMHGRLTAVFSRLAVQVESLTLTNRGNWRVELDSGAKLELGSGSDEEVTARATAFVETLPQVTARYQAPLEAADLRHRDGYAVRLKGATTHPDAPVKPAPGTR